MINRRHSRFFIGGALVNTDPSASSTEEGMNKFSEKNSGYILGMLIGAAAGGIAGAIIVNSLNYETLDLLSVRDKDKKNKLIKFIRQK